MKNDSEVLSSLLIAVVSVAAALSVGPGCGPQINVDAKAFCCTAGNAQTAFFTSSPAGCPPGRKCISKTDAANASAYAWCLAKPATPVVTGRPTSSPMALPAGGVVTQTPRSTTMNPLDPGVRPTPDPKGTVGGRAVVTPFTGGPSCLAECGPGNPECLMGSAPPTYAAALMRLVAAVQRDTRIEAGSLLQSFQVAADPCRRGPTLLEGGHLTNSGGACTFIAPYPAVRAQLRFELPPSLDAAIERRGNATMIRFNSIEDSPSVRIMPEALAQPNPMDAKLAGRIVQVESDASRVFLRTTGGCIGASIGGPAR